MFGCTYSLIYHPSIHPSVRPYVRPSVRTSVHLSIHPSIPWISIHSSTINLFFCFALCLFPNLSIHQNIYWCICLFLYRFVYVSSLYSHLLVAIPHFIQGVFHKRLICCGAKPRVTFRGWFPTYNSLSIWKAFCLFTTRVWFDPQPHHLNKKS